VLLFADPIHVPHAPGSRLMWGAVLPCALRWPQAAVRRKSTWASGLTRPREAAAAVEGVVPLRPCPSVSEVAGL